MDLILFTVRILTGKKLPLRMLCTVAVIALTALTVSHGIQNANDIKTVNYDVEITDKNIDGDITVALISDLHLGAVGSEERLGDIVKNLNEIAPDIVCIAGDLFDNDFSAINDPDGAISLLGSISSKYGVYACLGNHDAGETLPEMEELLRRAGVKLLKDEWVVIDDRFTVAGRLDPSPIGQDDEDNTQKRGDTASVLADADASLPIIVMDHNPSNIGDYKGLADLIMCGHTHKGQIFPGSIFTSLLYEVDYGFHKVDGDNPSVIVTSGVGTWGPPIRVGTSSEIAVITIRQAQP